MKPLEEECNRWRESVNAGGGCDGWQTAGQTGAAGVDGSEAPKGWALLDSTHLLAPRFASPHNTPRRTTSAH